MANYLLFINLFCFCIPCFAALVKIPKFNRYYEKRYNSVESDPRLSLLQEEYFKGKEVLDIGSNSGNFTIMIAKAFQPKKMIGLEVHEDNVRQAQLNLKYHLGMEGHCMTEDAEDTKDHCTKFPFNIEFRQGNYVLGSEEELENLSPKYDAILCLSVTRWIQISYGDAGLELLFQRIFRELRPGGVFILEPQSWPYAMRRGRDQTAEVPEHLKKFKLNPKDFGNFLVNHIGFCSVSELGTTRFGKVWRPMILLRKC